MERKPMKIVLSAVTSVAAICAATAGSAQEAELIVWSDTARLTAFELYDETHDNVALAITTVAPGDLVTKLQLALQAGNDIPDVIFMSDIGYTAQLSTRRSNYLMDLTDIIPQSLVDEFYPNSNSPCDLNGQLMCLRNDMAHFHIWYNTRLMDELAEAVPETWEDFASLGARLGPQGMVLGSAVEPYPLINFLVSGGCDFAAPVAGETDTLRIDATADSCLRAAQMVDEMVANGSLATVGPFDPAFVALVQDDKVPLLLGPTWFGEYVIKATYQPADGETAAAMPPRWSDQDEPIIWSWGGGTYGGWRDTAHPDEVVDLITWMATDVAHQTDAVTLPAHAPSADAWGAAVAEDPFYANDQTFAIEVEAAQYSDPNYVSLRVDISAAVAKTLTASVSAGGTVVEALPDLQQELVNQAELNGYTVAN